MKRRSVIVICLCLGILMILAGFQSRKDDGNPRTPAAVETENDPTLLKDFNRKLTNISSLEEGQKIYDSLNLDLTNNFGLECGSRAHVWAWQMKKNWNVESGKIFLYFTPKSFNHTGMLWGFHVVPYVVIDGQEYVMEKIREYRVGSGGYSIGQKPLFAGPVLLSQWLEKLTGFSDCNELDNEDDSERDWLSYFNTMKMIPDPHANCHIRKTPADFWWPTSVYNHTFNGWSPAAINEMDALSACEKSMMGQKKKDRHTACERIL